MRAEAGGLPLGAVLAAITAAGILAVGLLHLDGLPISLCVFRGVTGWPCLTCGSTRAFGRLFAGDLAGALALNPLAVLVALGVTVWGVLDALLMWRGRRLAVCLAPGLVPFARFAAFALLGANWLYLIAAAR